MDKLTLENHVCFALHVLSRQITNLYRPLLEQLDLTYPQYLVMLLLWEHEQLSVKELGERLTLDSGTLTPLLKRMEQKGLVTRQRDPSDERLVQIRITQPGQALKEAAERIPAALAKELPISAAEAEQLKTQVDGLLNRLGHHSTACLVLPVGNEPV